MSKITNPGDEAVTVGRWVISPKSSKATHCFTGKVVEQLPDNVATLPIIQDFVNRGVLEDDARVAKIFEAPEEPTPAVYPSIAALEFTKTEE
jgi:hypothetical protein